MGTGRSEFRIKEPGGGSRRVRTCDPCEVGQPDACPRRHTARAAGGRSLRSARALAHACPFEPSHAGTLGHRVAHVRPHPDAHNVSVAD